MPRIRGANSFHLADVSENTEPKNIDEVNW